MALQRVSYYDLHIMGIPTFSIWALRNRIVIILVGSRTSYFQRMSSEFVYYKCKISSVVSIFNGFVQIFKEKIFIFVNILMGCFINNKVNSPSIALNIQDSTSNFRTTLLKASLITSI